MAKLKFITKDPERRFQRIASDKDSMRRRREINELIDLCDVLAKEKPEFAEIKTLLQSTHQFRSKSSPGVFARIRNLTKSKPELIEILQQQQEQFAKAEQKLKSLDPSSDEYKNLELAIAYCQDSVGKRMSHLSPRNDRLAKAYQNKEDSDDKHQALNDYLSSEKKIIKKPETLETFEFTVEEIPESIKVTSGIRIDLDNDFKAISREFTGGAFGIVRAYEYQGDDPKVLEICDSEKRIVVKKLQDAAHNHEAAEAMLAEGTIAEELFKAQKTADHPVNYNLARLAELTDRTPVILSTYEVFEIIDDEAKGKSASAFFSDIGNNKHGQSFSPDPSNMINDSVIFVAQAAGSIEKSMCDMHLVGVCHYDLAPRNAMMQTMLAAEHENTVVRVNAKLIDFGFSQKIDPATGRSIDAYPESGPVRWVDDTILQRNGNPTAISDLYAFKTSMINMLTAQAGMPETEFIAYTRGGDLTEYISNRPTENNRQALSRFLYGLENYINSDACTDRLKAAETKLFIDCYGDYITQIATLPPHATTSPGVLKKIVGDFQKQDHERFIDANAAYQTKYLRNKLMHLQNNPPKTDAEKQAFLLSARRVMELEMPHKLKTLHAYKQVQHNLNDYDNLVKVLPNYIKLGELYQQKYFHRSLVTRNLEDRSQLYYLTSLPLPQQFVQSREFANFYNALYSDKSNAEVAEAAEQLLTYLNRNSGNTNNQISELIKTSEREPLPSEKPPLSTVTKPIVTSVATMDASLSATLDIDKGSHYTVPKANPAAAYSTRRTSEAESDPGKEHSYGPLQRTKPLEEIDSALSTSSDLPDEYTTLAQAEKEMRTTESKTTTSRTSHASLSDLELTSSEEYVPITMNVSSKDIAKIEKDFQTIEQLFQDNLRYIVPELSSLNANDENEARMAALENVKDALENNINALSDAYNIYQTLGEETVSEEQLNRLDASVLKIRKQFDSYHKTLMAELRDLTKQLPNKIVDAESEELVSDLHTQFTTRIPNENVLQYLCQISGTDYAHSLGRQIDYFNKQSSMILTQYQESQHPRSATVEPELSEAVSFKETSDKTISAEKALDYLHRFADFHDASASRVGNQTIIKPSSTLNTEFSIDETNSEFNYKPKPEVDKPAEEQTIKAMVIALLANDPKEIELSGDDRLCQQASEMLLAKNPKLKLIINGEALEKGKEAGKTQYTQMLKV